ncbi:mycothiol synthase [Actinoplanes sp. DH11]|uniref:mycothiol synthase n=1 Tax=Actinoplanes sp. DH11 TaxID=2857011 RepID=UPI001E3F772C|nr:mycothiol synthase [Actinoplanes sp. DH11]
MQPVRAADRLSASEINDVLALAAAAAEADGVHPLSEDVVLRVRGDAPHPGVHLLSYASPERLAGYAYVSEGSGELVVHPQFRRRRHGTALLAAAGTGPLSFWAHGDDPGAAVFADRNGFTRARVLWQMRRSLLEPLPEIPFPPGVTVRPFQPGTDEQAWLDINARAFAHHPEQGRWTHTDLLAREAEPWFDPAGFLLAVPDPDQPSAPGPASGSGSASGLASGSGSAPGPASGSGSASGPASGSGSASGPASGSGSASGSGAASGSGKLAGFHWTKIHPAEGTDPAIGEIYVLGIDPTGHRRGLGAALSVAGLTYLAGRGLTIANLYVDESNEAAVKLYRRLGFQIHKTDISYQRP